jgi:hypothetical protein
MALLVDPTRCIGISLYLEVFLEVLASDDLACVQKTLNLSKHERVSFDGSRVVSFLVPNPRPNLPGFLRPRQAAVSVPKFLNFSFKALVDHGTRGTTSR